MIFILQKRRQTIVWMNNPFSIIKDDMGSGTFPGPVFFVKASVRGCHAYRENVCGYFLDVRINNIFPGISQNLKEKPIKYIHIFIMEKIIYATKEENEKKIKSVSKKE